MKFVYVALLFTSLIAIGTATSIVCQADLECKLTYGQFCFCMKGQQQLGECICNMDPKILNECTQDSHCKSQETTETLHSGGHYANYKVRTFCNCHRDSPSQAHGQCKCQPGLLG